MLPFKPLQDKCKSRLKGGRPQVPLFVLIRVGASTNKIMFIYRAVAR
jgi:hypothetical protein